jgi:hypothetical protein
MYMYRITFDDVSALKAELKGKRICIKIKMRRYGTCVSAKSPRTNEGSMILCGNEATTGLPSGTKVAHVCKED